MSAHRPMSTTALTVIQCMLAAPVHASTGGSPAEPDERHPRRRLAFGISSGHKLSGISFFLAKAPHRRSHEVSGCFCLSVCVFLKRLRTVTATLDPRLGARRPFATPAAPTRPPAVPARQLSEESKHETSNPLTGEAAYRPPSPGRGREDVHQRRMRMARPFGKKLTHIAVRATATAWPAQVRSSRSTRSWLERRTLWNCLVM